MNAIRTLVIAALAGCGFAVAAPVFTNPIGYVSITCPPNSDTIVGLPLRTSAAYTGSLSANPEMIPDNPETTTVVETYARLTLSGTPSMTVNEFAGAYYVKFKDMGAASDGQWFSVIANDSNTITVDLNGGSIAAVSGAQLEVLKFWTLAELFPPADCTTSAATTGTAVVATADPDDIMTQILIPSITGTGINLAPSQTYYLLSGSGWKKFGQSLASNFGSFILWPDTYFIIRNPSIVGAATTYTVSGEVEMGGMIIPLSTRVGGMQDNFVAIPRGIDMTLSQLNLGGTSAFVTTADPDDIQDQLLLFNNQSAIINRAPSTTYYYYNGAWRKFGQSLSINAGSDIVPAGYGIIIRKAQTAGGTTSLWDNPPGY